MALPISPVDLSAIGNTDGTDPNFLVEIYVIAGRTITVPFLATDQEKLALIDASFGEGITLSEAIEAFLAIRNGLNAFTHVADVDTLTAQQQRDYVQSIGDTLLAFKTNWRTVIKFIGLSAINE